MPGFVDELERMVDAPTSVDTKFSDVSGLYEEWLAREVVESSVELAGADAGVIAGVIAAVAGFVGLPEIVVLAIALILVILLADILLGLAGKLPSVWNIRSAAVSLVIGFIGPLNALKQTILGLIGTLIGDILDSFIKLLRFLAPYAGISSQHVTTITSTGTSATVQNEISHIEETNYQQWEAINYLQHQIAVITNAPNTAAISLQDQINTLVDNQTKLRNAIETEARDLVKLDTRLATVEDTLTRLQTQLHGVAAVSTTYGNELAQLQGITTGLENGLAATNTQVSANTHELGQLAPLAILTAAGAAGIKNLQKLEQDPCQCPKFGDISGALGTAIAVYELATNG